LGLHRAQFLIGKETTVRRIAITLFLLASFGFAHAADPKMAVADTREHAPLSIAIDDAKGASFRLVYTAGNGWKFADHSAAKLASVGQQEGPTGPIKPLPTDKPQSVFVDGPSGYVFVYVIDEGWRFVGSVADGKR
jgi:hypothetical protein